MVQKTHKQYEQQLFDREIDFFPIEQYTKAKDPILHECLKGHIWKVRPDDILKGRGCPKCSLPGFDYSAPSLLYFISFDASNQRLYKLGITNKSLYQRYGAEWKQLNMKTVWITSCNNGYDAFHLEQQLKLKYSDYLVECTLLRRGNTEVFNQHIPKPVG